MAFNPSNTSLIISAGQTRQFPARALPQVVFSGRSNVGKSSMINTLLGRRSMARVSSSPGKTVTVNFYNVDEKLVFVDLPGYGFARRSAEDQARWSELTEGFFTKNRNIDLLKLAVQLVDLEVGPTKDDLLMISYLKNTGIPFVIAASKSDKPNKTNRAAAIDRMLRMPELAAPGGTVLIPCSSKTGEGREELWDRILRACGL